MRPVEWILSRPWLPLGLVFLAVVVALIFWPRFVFDASSDTLVVKGDPKLIDYLQTARRFSNDEFVVLTWRPRDGSVFERRALAALAGLEEDLQALVGVADVLSILDLPLLRSPALSLEELSEDYRTLRDPSVDLDAARAELTASTLFGGQLISADGHTVALRIGLESSPEFSALVERRNVLHGKPDLTAAERANLDVIEAQFRQAQLAVRDSRARLIADIREVRDRHAGEASMHLGGVPMIAADMIDYVKRDVALFGALVIVIFVIVLWLFFRRARWIVLPLVTAALTIALLVGWLGFLDTPVTVVSSNFMALIGIITISFTIHLVVRHRELLSDHPQMTQRELVVQSVESKLAPSFYTALTDMVAFASLLTATIVPVEDFGWMMCVGVAFAFVVTFAFYPAVSTLLPKGKASVTLAKNLWVTEVTSVLSRRHYRWVIGVAAVVAVITAYGLTLISVENRFVEYFSEDSEIRQGLEFIDQELGGTLPFEVILSFPPFEALDPDDPFYAGDDEDPFPERYWITPEKLAVVDALSVYVLQQAGVGSAQSLADFERVGRDFNDGAPLSSVQIAAALGAIPEHLRVQLIEPFASPASGELRISGRVRDSDVAIDRLALVERIRQHATNELGIEPGNVRVTGMLVLFEDALQQLFSSQVNTIAWVFAATLVMFLLLLRSITLALIGVVPIMLAAAATISFMGYAGIPLDMMTITVASIAVGIGVDDAIHYLHRFREEFRRGNDVEAAVAESHASIGRAMYFTSVVIVAGFSILVFSNFTPTIHFGILTAVAMVVALTANLTLLPSLLMLVYGRGAEHQRSVGYSEPLPPP